MVQTLKPPYRETCVPMVQSLVFVSRVAWYSELHLPSAQGKGVLFCRQAGFREGGIAVQWRDFATTIVSPIAVQWATKVGIWGMVFRCTTLVLHSGHKHHDSHRHDEMLHTFLRPELSQISQIWGGCPKLHRRPGEKGRITGGNSKSPPPEMVPRNCRFCRSL